MLFNSNIFIFAFLPIIFILYHTLCYFKQNLLAKIAMIIASFVFYAWFDFNLIFILIAYILINYCFYHLLVEYKSKILLTMGIALNIGILMYFKYKFFIIENINLAFDTHIFNPAIILPLGISFITFQQIAFLSDCYLYQKNIKKIINNWGGGLLR